MTLAHAGASQSTPANPSTKRHSKASCTGKVVD